MDGHIAKASPDVQRYEPFDDEILAVEQAWGEPIPDDLVRIGGVDWWSWARVTMVDTNDGVRFEGAFRDARVLYEGPLVYEHRDGAPVPQDVFERYVMSYLSVSKLVFQEQGEPPVDSFYLVPADPSRLRWREFSDDSD